jgi:hypothetical protein
MYCQKSGPVSKFAIGLLFSGAVAFAQTQTPQTTVAHPVKFAISPRMSQVERATAAPGFLPVVLPLLTTPRAEASNLDDGALQTDSAPLVNATQGVQFDGVNDSICNCAPSDANMAVGPNHVVQTVNTAWAVYDKSGNVFPGFPKTLGSIWNAIGAPCNGQWGDPIAQYDNVADRWVLSQLGSFSAPFFHCIAVSTTNDPTGTYALYAYAFNSNLPDYPKMGVWPTDSNPAYLATYNLFANGQTFAGSQACAYDRTAMLAGSASATQICFTTSNEGTLMPSDLDGATIPPAGSPGYFVTFESNGTALHEFKLTPNFASPSSSTFVGPVNIPVATFTEACNGSGGACIPQSGTRQQLDTLGDRLMYRLAYRNFGDHESLVVNHSVTASSKSRRSTVTGVRWYELRSPNTTPTVFQQGTFSPDSTSRWMASAAMDKAGDIAIGYSISSSSIQPGIAFTGRTPSDASGTLESEAIMFTGTGSQTGNRLSRWGDYSGLRIDPSDDCTFWYTNQYIPTNGSFNWSTRIGSFKMNNCQ